MNKNTNTASATTMQNLLVFGCLLFGMAFFGTGTPTAKMVTEVFPLFLAPFLRLLAAAMLTTPILIWYRHELRELSKSSWLYIIGIGMVSRAHYRSEKIAKQEGQEYEACHATPC